MGIVDSLIHLPTAEQWPLIKPLILLMLLFFLPFMGLLLISTIVSVAFRLVGKPKELSLDLIDLGLKHPAAWLVFGLFPMVTMLFLFSQYLYGFPIAISAYLTRILGLLIVGFVLVLFYRRTLLPPLGALGALVLMGGLYHFHATVSLVAMPERWALVELPLPFYHSIQPVIFFSIFLMGALLFTGASILVAYFHWPEREIFTPEGERTQLAHIAYGMLLVGIFPIPILLIADYLTAPFFTLNSDSFFIAGWMLVVLLLLGLFLIRMISGGHTRHGWATFMLSLAFLGLFAGRQQHQITIGNQENELAVVRETGEIRAELVAAREELYAAASELPENAGEQLFNTICSACHAFDTRVVGPPYNDVLEKYAGDLEGLAGFIFSPSKVDEDYPAMPNQGLRRAEARAVAAYLLAQFTGEPAGEVEEAGGAAESAEDSHGEGLL